MFFSDSVFQCFFSYLRVAEMLLHASNIDDLKVPSREFPETVKSSPEAGGLQVWLRRPGGQPLEAGRPSGWAASQKHGIACIYKHFSHPKTRKKLLRGMNKFNKRKRKNYWVDFQAWEDCRSGCGGSVYTRSPRISQMLVNTSIWATRIQEKNCKEAMKKI